MHASTESRAKGRARLIALRALLVLGSALVACVVGELWLLPLALPLGRDAFLLGFVAPVEAIDDVPINSLGLTGDVPSETRPERGLRVLTLGGSVLFNRRFTERLDRALEAQAKRPVELLGAALRAHTSWTSVLKYRYLRRYRFDVVVLGDGINDLQANHVAPADFRTDYEQLGPYYRRGPLLDHSIIARMLYDRFVYTKPEKLPCGTALRSIEILRANLERLIDEVRADGGKPVLCTTAWAIPEGYDMDSFWAGTSGYSNPDRYDPCAVEHWGPVEYVRDGLIELNRTIRDVARERSVPLFDAEAVIAGDLSKLGDVCHPNDAGVAALVLALAEFLDENGLLAERAGSG